MSSHLHILTPGNDVDPDQLSGLSLASSRLRLGPAVNAAKTLGMTVTAGDQCASSASVVLIGKIGAGNINQRAAHWLRTLGLAKDRDARVILDYTDHHLETSSVMTPFYQQAVTAADCISVPTPALADVLKPKVSSEADICVIDDFLEYTFIPPQARKSSSPLGLWFGHPSNARFLGQLIEAWPDLPHPGELLVVSSTPTLDVLQKFPFSSAPRTTIKFMPWSLKAMKRAASACDYAVIPSDPNSPKRFASNNRLVTALALGLPTVATAIPSYQEFAPYFTALGTSEATSLMTRPDGFLDSVHRFQAEQADRFSRQNVLDAWVSVLS